MNHEDRFVAGTAVAAAAAGIGFCFVVARYHTHISKKLKSILNYDDPLRNQQIHVVTGVEECRRLMQTLKSHCDEFNVLGFDCEWVTVGGTRRPVALLQLTSHRGLCVLIRLPQLQTIPSELEEILGDDSIMKVGVAPQGDANYLVRDYGVCVASTFDLRYLASMTGCVAAGLGKMSENYLNVKLDKNWRIRCSDWESPTLNDSQIDYAAKDAHVAIELFKFFAARLKQKGAFEKQSTYVQNVIDKYCFRYFDLTYNGAQTVPREKDSLSKKKNSNVSSNLAKERKFPTRQKPLYANCFLEASDGELLSTSYTKNAMWYVRKGLGEIVKQNPLTVRLNFEPAGRAVGQAGEFYQQTKENKCVVCGDSKKYNRKNVVPREYRKYFPPVMKDHTSHDVILLCPQCLQRSNMHDYKLRKKLAEECDAPLENANLKSTEIPRLKEIKLCSRALLHHRDQMPQDRRNQLSKRLQELCLEEEDVMSDEFLQANIDIDTNEENENFCSHGAKVVEFYQNSQEGLVGLERRWRMHFLETMKPTFLPELWSIDHNAERLKIRAHEGRVDEHDLRLAGLTTPDGTLGTQNRKKKKTTTRQEALRTNCFLEANDGELLCKIYEKNAMWYVRRGIGEIVKQDPLTVRLKFEPSGRAIGQADEYYQKSKENKCFVCGESEQHSRKNVVPREYRKYFPSVMKNHASHDVILLCPHCHQTSNMHDLKLREKLATECDAPLTSKNTKLKTIEDQHSKEIKSCSRALFYHRNQIPEDRQNQLFKRLQELCSEEDVRSNDFLQVHIDANEENENVCTHGAKVVEFYQNSPEGLIGLERRWRKHFWETMKPKFLPDLWSIDHNVSRNLWLKIRANEGLIDDHDMQLAGLTMPDGQN